MAVLTQRYNESRNFSQGPTWFGKRKVHGQSAYTVGSPTSLPDNFNTNKYCGMSARRAMPKSGTPAHSCRQIPKYRPRAGKTQDDSKWHWFEKIAPSKKRTNSWNQAKIPSFHETNNRADIQRAIDIFRLIEFNCVTIASFKETQMFLKHNLWLCGETCRPAVLKWLDFILGGSKLCQDSVNSIKSYQRRVYTDPKGWSLPKGTDTTLIFWESKTSTPAKPHDDALVIRIDIGGFDLAWVMKDTGSSVDQLFYRVL